MAVKLISILLFLGSSALLIWFFLKSDKGAKEPRPVLFGAFGFGLVAAIFAIWGEKIFINSGSGGIRTLGGVFAMSMMVGVIEESAKFLPMALFLKNKSYFNEHTDGVVYFAIVGLTFGLIENLTYLLIYTDRLGGSQLTGLIRLVVLLFFHAASTGIVGYYFAKAKLHKQSLWHVGIALVIIMLIHGFYDYLFFYSAFVYARTGGFLSQDQAAMLVMAIVGGLIISALLNTFMFLYYGRARQWDYSNGLAIDPKRPNPAQAQLAVPIPPVVPTTPVV